MCGIFGVITTLKNQNIYKIIIDGLTQLQNRGYDSSGLCTLSELNTFNLYKYASTEFLSSIDMLSNLNLENDNSYLGIGHNRWATHGIKNDINAHPHLSNNKKFVIVHNGIIENYQILKIFLASKGYNFYSQTDTEIIINLVSYFYDIENDTIKAIQQTIKKLEGTYAMIIMHNEELDKMYCIRNGSPLLVGINNEYIIITSEQSGFYNMIYNYIILDDDDICILTKYKDQIKIETKNTYDIKKVNIITSNLTPFPYKHWTIKDIYDQPETIINSLKNRINNNKIILSELDKNIELFKNIQNIIILGCGTSYHSGLFCSHYFKKICNFNTIQVIDGAELNEYDFPKIGKTILILVSQSGETKDLHRCIKIAQNYKILTIGIINVIDSLIAREVDNVIYCNAGCERSVASTKTFTSQIICLSLFAIWFAQINNLNENIRIEMINDLNNLKNNFRNIIYNNEIQDIAIKIKDYNNLFILGKGIDESIAREGSLKIKEISYIHSEAYSTSSLKHGPFALLDENFPTIIINCQNEYTNKVMNCFEEVKSRNSPIILITNNDYNFIKDCHIIKIINNNTFGSLLAIIPLQLLAYYLSINKNINPDIPRNLAKVVTVE